MFINNENITTDIIVKQDHGLIAKWDKNTSLVTISSIEEGEPLIEQFQEINSKHRAVKLLNLLIDKYYFNKLLDQVNTEIELEKNEGQSTATKNMDIYKQYVEDILESVLHQIYTITK